MIVAMLVLAVIVIGFVAAALTNPWHLVGLYPLGHEGLAIAMLVLAGALVAGAGLWQLVDSGSSVGGGLWRGRRAIVGLVVAPVAVAAFCVGGPTVALGDSFRREGAGETLSVSADGNFSAVKSTLDTKGGPRTRIYIRSRAGLFSREAATPAAECPYDPFDRGVPPEAVRFTGENTLAVPLADMPTTVVRFDPDTLAPERTVMMCSANP
jgi:hypothetical protein